MNFNDFDKAKAKIAIKINNGKTMIAISPKSNNVGVTIAFTVFDKTYLDNMHNQAPEFDAYDCLVKALKSAKDMSDDEHKNSNN